MTVEDEGPGIASEHRQRVFDRFFRAPDQSQLGSGLGLAIVRAVALCHRARDRKVQDTAVVYQPTSAMRAKLQVIGQALDKLIIDNPYFVGV